MWSCYLVKVLFVIPRSSFLRACLNNLIPFLWVGFYYSWFMDACTQPDMDRKMTGKGKAFFLLLKTKWYYFLQMKNSLLLCSLPSKYLFTPNMCFLITSWISLVVHQYSESACWIFPLEKKCFWTPQNFFSLKLRDASVRIYFNF